MAEKNYIMRVVRPKNTETAEDGFYEGGITEELELPAVESGGFGYAHNLLTDTGRNAAGNITGVITGEKIDLTNLVWRMLPSDTGAKILQYFKENAFFWLEYFDISLQEYNIKQFIRTSLSAVPGPVKFTAGVPEIEYYNEIVLSITEV